MPKRKTPKVRGFYWRVRTDGSPPRAWADFRHVGGTREPLCAKGETLATTDEDVARGLYNERLQAIREGATLAPVGKSRRHLGPAVAEYLEYRRSISRSTDNWLVQQELFLGRAVEFFGPDKSLRSIGANELVEWIVALRTAKTTRGVGFAEETIRKHLHAVNGLYRRASRERTVPEGYNPVSVLDKAERPARDPSPDVWLEVDEAARLLEAARTYRPAANEPLMRLAYPLIATFLLSGGRSDEVLGLDITDLLFDRKLVAFRPTPWRRGKKGKTAGANRVVPMFPQLEAILHDYITTTRLDILVRHGFELGLLFPSPETGSRIRDLRKMIDRLCERAGLQVGVYRAIAFRKTYATARLQTLDNGAPIAQRTVQAELGHASGAMLEKVYGRLGTVRHRSDVLEYRVRNGAENGATQGEDSERVQAVNVG